MNVPKRTTKKVWLLLIISLLPVAAGWLLFHYHTLFSLKTMNHGILINPPVHSEMFDMPGKQHQWQIIYMPGIYCDKQCDEVMFSLHQLHTGLGKESQRVMLKVVIANNAVVNNRPDFQNIILTPGQITQLQQMLVQQMGADFVLLHKIYLMDPADNLFMYYEDTSNLMDILKDLKRVLEVSQIG
jgi:hypothetical protein